MNLQMEGADNTAKVDHGNDSKAVFVKSHQGGDDTSKDAAKATGDPNVALHHASSSSAGVANAGNHKTILNNVGRRKKKRRRKKTTNNKPKVQRAQVDATKAKPGATVRETNLKSRAQVPAQAVNDATNKWFHGPSNADQAANFGQFNDPEVIAIDKGVLDNDGGGGQAEAEPEIHDKEGIGAPSIDKTLVNWEHLALIIEEHFLTTRSV